MCNDNDISETLRVLAKTHSLPVLDSLASRIEDETLELPYDDDGTRGTLVTAVL